MCAGCHLPSAYQPALAGDHAGAAGQQWLRLLPQSPGSGYARPQDASPGKEICAIPPEKVVMNSSWSSSKLKVTAYMLTYPILACCRCVSVCFWSDCWKLQGHLVTKYNIPQSIIYRKDYNGTVRRLVRRQCQQLYSSPPPSPPPFPPPPAPRAGFLTPCQIVVYG